MKINLKFKYTTRILLVVSVFLLLSCIGNPDVTIQELKSHIMILSSDSLKGRMTGSEGDSLAALYIKSEMASYGMTPISGDGFQSLKVIKRIVPGKSNSLKINDINFTPEKDFMPMAFSSNSGLESEVVFAGYGFNINGDSLKWNDYKDIDVKGKWVLILRADPDQDNANSLFLPFSDDRDKAMVAKDMGAAGILLVSGTSFDPMDTFESLNNNEFSVDIPALRLKRDVADAILAKSHTSTDELEKKINSIKKPISFATGVIVNAVSEITRENANTRNVVMVLPGEDEQLKNEYIIIGAHFDHLGMGGPGSSSRATDTVAVHHGADDNASGVAMMLELAEKFAMTKGSHKRSIVCIAFTGEELGLLGSKYFAENPGIDLSKVNAMINLDMVGRLQETNVLQISGVGTSEKLKDIISSENDTSILKLTLSEEGYGPSDHSSFYGKNIPVLFFTSGAHLDYHTPADTYDKINYQGMVNISSLVYKITSALASSSDRLQFREAGPKAVPGRVMRRKWVTLGIMPDFAGNVKNGLRADFVTPGKPAALGGMKKGDIITAINGKTVNNIQDYMFRMGQLKHGETISVEIMRNGKKEVLIIQL
ncbi:MAG TPA: M20/M25/M40 family metallo-hydrolase [Bacteroidales bacterium]|nr:M20/M25/M40 family metallo-hydrolase [Bacteroidales bacterium]HPT21633.1 M20/M25/M40 family metallo-hydrolase [Bacteroidales bacterium]